MDNKLLVDAILALPPTEGVDEAERLERAHETNKDLANLMGVPADPSDPLFALAIIYVKASLDVALFHGVCLLLSTEDESSLRKMPEDDYLPFIKLYPEMALVYRVSIFDAFLNSLTSWAYARNPAKAVSDAQLQASQLFKKKSHDLVNEYIAKKTKSLSRENFRNRIDVLASIMKIDFRITKAEFDALSVISATRNALVHEGTAYEFRLDENFNVHSARSLTKVENVAIPNHAAMQWIVSKIYYYTATKFIGRSLHPAEWKLMEALHPEGHSTFIDNGE